MRQVEKDTAAAGEGALGKQEHLPGRKNGNNSAENCIFVLKFTKDDDPKN